MASCGSIKCHDRAHLVDKGAAAPAAHGKPVQGQREEKLEQRCDHERRNGAAGGGHAHHGIVGQLVLAQGCPDAEGTADDKGQGERHGAELEGHRQARLEQFRDGEIRQIVAGAEIALQKVLQIEQVLFPQRLIEMENPLEIGLDDGIEPLLLVERAARRHPHQEKRNRHDHEESRDGGQKSPKDIAQHG